jgi:uncharacterized protein (UPF0218 family)
MSWKLRCRGSVHSGRWPSIQNRTQTAGEHEEALYGLGDVVALCCISCCKVYALAHVDIRSKRPVQTAPTVAPCIHTCMIQQLPHILRSSLPGIIPLCLGVEPDEALGTNFITDSEQLRDIYI